MSYEPLLKRLTELREAASPGPWRVEGSSVFDAAKFEALTGVLAYDAAEANAALAAPAHEYAAVAEALVALSAICKPNEHAVKSGHLAVQKATMERTIPYPVAIAAQDALDALAKALGP